MANVTVDGTVSSSNARAARCVVFTTKDIGYIFYIDSDGTFGYSKTTDGGASWGAQVEINSATTHVAHGVWFDKWTPGDTGTLIHTWFFDSTNDTVRWRSLDTNGDTLGTLRTVLTGASAVAGRGAFVSGTKTRSGYLYCAFDIDAGAERGLHRSTDSGTTWSANLSTTFVEATIDECLLFPASNTGDNNDCWAVYQDASTDELTLKMWDSSAASASESAEIGASMAEGVTDLTHQRGFAGSVRHSDGHLIVAVMTAYDASTDHRVYDINGTGSITELTAIQTGTDDHYHPNVFIDQPTGDIYVAYSGKRDGSSVLTATTSVYYTKSTDDGTTWSSGDTDYREGTAGITQVWAPLMGPRFYAAWREAGTTIVGNAVNSLALPALSMTGGLSFAGAAAKLTSRALAGVLSFAGELKKLTSRALSGVLSFAGAFVGELVAEGNLFEQPLTAALSFAGSLSRMTGKALAGALSFAGTAQRLVSHVLSGALSFSGAAAKRTFRAVAGALSFSGARRALVGHVLAGALGFSGALRRAVSRGLAGALGFSGAVRKRTSRALAGAASLSGACAKRAGHVLSAALSATGALAKRVGRGLAGALSFVGGFAGNLVTSGTAYFQPLAASLGLSGALARTRLVALFATLTLSSLDLAFKLPARFAALLRSKFTWIYGRRAAAAPLAARGSTFAQEAGEGRGTRMAMTLRRPPTTVI